MKINSFRLVAVAAAVAAAGGALAINISATSTAPLYASELVYSASAPIASQVASSVLGFGVSGSQQRFIRLDLTNATFSDAVTNTNAPQTPAAASLANSQWVSGGASGTSNAIFQITANAAGQSPTDVVSLQIPKMIVTSNASPVTVTYQLFETAGAAVANTGSLFSATGPLARFGSGLSTTAVSGTARTTVSSGYTKWASTAVSGPANTAALGTLAINVATGSSATVKRDGTAAGLADFLSGGSLSVTGDFTAAVASGVYLGSSATAGLCNPLTPAAIFALDATKTTATLTVPGFSTSAPWGTTAATLCYTVSGASIIPVATYSNTATLSFLTLASGVSGTQPGAATIGAVTRDGSTLQAPFIQTTTGYVSRIILTNTGSTDAAYTGEVKAGPTLDGGSAVNSVTKNAALSGTIKAGSQVVIEGTAMPTFLGTARGFVVFTVAGTNDVVNGIYQITNIATGAISNTNLVRPVSAYGTQP